MFSNALILAAYQAILYFSSSFYRQVFQISKAYASFLIVGSAFSFTLGSQVGGRNVDKYGRKFMSSVPAFLGGLVIIGFKNIQNLYISIGLRF